MPTAPKPPESVVEEYSYGMCMWLALAIHDRYGWPILAQFDRLPDGTEYIAHAHVRDPGGRQVDILGPQVQVDQFGSGETRPVDPDDIRKLAGSPEELRSLLLEASIVMEKYNCADWSE
jgi:hypothetical protein